ncbi:MAG TPA: hypothetical protein DEB48_04510 [Verrucomicrobiales bacterium]|nr:hypothetical protein [Verrucomicrobiales bacterium]|tara:strand:- start:5345 stop:6601 length:1257 start_codon:yes stop_codon:yes gene_type:complete
MSKAKTQAIDFLKELGSVNAVTTEASNVSLPESLTYNSHIHLPPNFSAFETVEQAVELAADQGVRVLGCGNYYDYSVYQRFTETARDKNVFPSFGTEIIALETDLQQKDIRINDPGNPGRHYICGKAISRFEDLSSRADELLSGIRNNDKLRMTEMVVKMAAVFSEHGIDTGLDDQAVIARVVKRHGCSADTVTLQERHLAQAFQEVFFDEVSEGQRQQKLTDIFRVSSQSNPSDTVGIQNEIRSNLMKAGKICFVPETFVNLAQAKELICELGGIPCYPVLADGSKKRCEYETPVEQLIERLKDNHYTMVELITIRNSPEVLVEYVSAIRQAGIAVVAGTEHNTLDLLPIKPACVGGQAVPEEIDSIFKEGICVLAAHAFLKAHGEEGFVDGQEGNANQRIEDFSRIGAVVLKNYFG